MKIMHKNMKYIPQMSSDSGNLLVLSESEVAGANSGVRFVTRSS